MQRDAEGGSGRIGRWVPGVRTLSTYRTAWLTADLLAALTILAVLIPQGMAYGSLAGVAPVVGLYAAIGALVGYFFFGSSRQLMVGPESGVAVMAAAAIAPLAAGGDAARYSVLIAMLAILVGIILMIAGMAKAGVVADFLSKPILIGYTNGVALIVISTQLGKLFGISIEADNFFPIVKELLTSLDETSWLTLAIGLILIAFLGLMRRFLPRIPGALVTVVLATAASAAFGLSGHGVAVVGPIPAGLPRPKVPDVSFTDIYNLLPAAFSISLVAFADGILTARLFARKHNYAIDANQEMIGLGAASITSGFLQGFPVGASNSRTVVNDDAGGRTQLVGLFTAAFVAVFLLFFTPLLTQMPTVTLAAIVMVAAYGLLDFGAIARLYRVLKVEALLASITLLAVLVLGILYGVVFAVAVSLFTVVARISRPHSAILGPVPEVDGFREIDPKGSSQSIPGLIAYRFDAPLFFANSNCLLNDVRELVRTAEPPLRWVVLDAEGMVNGDSTAVDALKTLADELHEQEIFLAVARASAPLRTTLDRGGFVDKVGNSALFPTVRTAVQAYLVSQSGDAGPQVRGEQVTAGAGGRMQWILDEVQGRADAELQGTGPVRSEGDETRR